MMDFLPQIIGDGLEWKRKDNHWSLEQNLELFMAITNIPDGPICNRRSTSYSNRHGEKNICICPVDIT